MKYKQSVVERGNASENSFESHVPVSEECSESHAIFDSTSTEATGTLTDE